MSEKSSTVYTSPFDRIEHAASSIRPVPFAGEIVSRSYEPPPGWRGRLTEPLPNALVFRSDEECAPLLPTLLPAFCLLSPSFPDSPGSARIRWTRDENEAEVDHHTAARTARWLPSALRALLRPGVILEHAVISGSSMWRIEGIASIVESREVERPRLVLAPPRRRDRIEVHRAILRSLYRAIRSMPPENDLQRLVSASRTFMAAEHRSTDILRLSVLSELVGFGSGRTACGDDYLVGFICGLDLGSSIDTRIDPSRFHEFRSLFVRAIDRFIERTSLLGNHVLLAAFHGLYSTPLLDEADALSDGIIIGPGEPEWTLARRPTVSPGWPALLGLLSGAYVMGTTKDLTRSI